MGSKSNSEILTTPLLVSKVAEELGISEAVVKGHVKFFAHWINHLSEKEEICQIQIPHVGHMYPNVRRAFIMTEKLKDLEEKGHTLSPNQQKVKDSLSSKNDFIRSKYPEMKNFSYHGGKTRFGNMYFRKGMGIVELEKYQNEKNSQ